MGRHRLHILGLLLVLQVLVGCESGLEDSPNIAPDEAFLVVHIYGSLSGEDREDIRVSLHWTKEDAENNDNAIIDAYTDDYGEVGFYGLDPNEVYWVRGKALLAKTIRQTNYLNIGENYIEIPIL